MMEQTYLIKTIIELIKAKGNRMIVVTNWDGEVIVTLEVNVKGKNIQVIKKEGYSAHMVPNTQLFT